MNLNNGKTPIIFDFGGVLMDWDPLYLYGKLFHGDREAAYSFLEEIGFHEWNAQQDAGRSFDEAVRLLCDRFPQHCGLIRAYHDRWEESISGPIWPTVEILHRLHAAGYPLYGLSNWSDEKFQIVRRRYGFFDCFEDIVVSGAVRLVKPDERIFQVLLERVGLPARACLLIDDSEVNVAVARRLGFDAIHFQSPDDLAVELRDRGMLHD